MEKMGYDEFLERTSEKGEYASPLRKKAFELLEERPHSKTELALGFHGTVNQKTLGRITALFSKFVKSGEIVRRYSGIEIYYGLARKMK